MADTILGPMGNMRAADGSQPNLTPEAPKKPRTASDIALDYGLPRNVLMALEERGDDPEARAVEIKTALDQGSAIEDVVPFAALQRASDIADEIEGIQPTGGMGAAIGAGVDNIQQAFGSALEGAGTSLGLDGVAEAGGRIAENNAAQAASKSRGLTTLGDVDGLGSAGSYAAETVAGQTPQLATTVGPVAAGAAIGSVVAPGPGTLVGAGLGGAAALAANIAQFYGFNRERQKEENDGVVDEGAAFGTAIPQAATDLVSDALIATPLGLGPKALQTGTLATRIMKGAGLGAASEAPTEAAQQAMERAQAGLSVTGSDARGEYVESAVAGGLVGGLLGGGRGALTRRVEDDPTTNETAPEEEPLALPAPAIITPAPQPDAKATTEIPNGDGSVEGDGADTTNIPLDDGTVSASTDLEQDADRATPEDGLATTARPDGPTQNTADPKTDFDALPLEEAEWRLENMNTRLRRMKSPTKKLFATRDRLAEAVEAKKADADSLFEQETPDDAPRVESEEVAPVVPPPDAPGPTKAVIEPIRQKAAVLRGVPKNDPPDVGKISLKWDEKEKGFIFSRKHSDRVLEAVNQRAAAPVAEAATKTAPDPTPAQAEAENYKTGKAQWRGLTLSVENKKGSVRSKVTPDGKTAWSVTMPAHYGRILSTTGADGDHVDFYMGDDEASEQVFVVDQIEPKDGSFDEHKVMLGFADEPAARAAYEAGFSDGSGASRLGALTPMSAAEFQEAIKKPDVWKKPVGTLTGQETADETQKTTENAREDQEQVKKSEVDALTDTLRDEWTARENLPGAATDEFAAATTKVTEAAQALEAAAGDGSANAALEQIERDYQPSAPQTKEATKPGILSSLSEEKQARAAELKAKLAAKVRSQTSSGIDPDYIIMGGELVGLYIEGGARKFGQMLKDFAETTGLSMKEAQAPMRAAYNHVRDDMDLEGQDISDMDDAAAVMAEVRAALAEDGKGSQSEPKEAISDANPVEETPDESNTEQQDTRDDPESLEGSEPAGDTDASGRQRSTERGNVGSGEGDGEPSGGGDQLGTGVVGDIVRGSGDQATEPQGVSPGNFVISDGLALGAGTPGEKITANLAAIRLVKQLQTENRFATSVEQETLARYIGWGGLKRVFDPRETGKSNQWGKTQAELRELLTPDQYRAARYSTAHAHFTSGEVVSAMWDAMRGFGFDGGRVLEPTVGTGNFIGLQPQDLAERSEWFAAELDDLTGAMAQSLYPEATVFAGQGFEDAPFRPGTIDVAIGNPPFGSETLQSDLHPEIPPLSVHNFIIAKTGVLLRPGGIMGMVVTSRFLDTPNPQARSYLNEHFNFLGAVRLPNTAFKANAGTEVTTDVVWFQKRRDGEATGDQSWLETGVERDGVVMNGYFAARPEMMLGTPTMAGTMYGTDPEFTLENDGRDMPSAMRSAFANIEGSLSSRETQLEEAVIAPTLTSDLAIGEALLTEEGKVMMRSDDDANGNAVIEEVSKDTPWGPIAREMQMAQASIQSAGQAISKEDAATAQPAVDQALLAIGMTGAIAADGNLKKSPPTGMGKQAHAALGVIMEGLTAETPAFAAPQKRALREMKQAIAAKTVGAPKLAALKGMLGLRRDTVALLSAEMNNSPKMEPMRKKLRRSYRAFVKKHGFVNDPANQALVGGLPGAEAALEGRYTKANKVKGIEASATEASIMSQRINQPYQRAEKADSAADGIHISMRERGRLDMQHIADLTSQTIKEVIADLTGGDRPLAFYDPKAKDYVIADDYLSGNLAEKLKEARELGAQENVPHLERAMPEDKTAEQVTPGIRSLWIPEDVFEAFLSEMGATAPRVRINMKGGSIDVDAKGELTDFGQMFQTERKTPYDIFTSAARGKSIMVFDSLPGGKTVKNEKATQDANAAAERMGAEFEKWAYLNPERQAAIVDAFNEKMNVVVPQKYDGVSYLTQVGANPEIKLRDSQKNGAWRMMRSNSTLLHHVVGAGKTFTAITAIMERKRLGLSQKSMVVVPNHIVSQWSRDFYALYPGANILAATEKDFQLSNRRKLIARIATGDYDAVVIGHSSLRYIENNPEDTIKLLQEQMSDLEEALDEAKRSGASRATVSQAATRAKKYKEKMETITDKLNGDKLGFDFAALGVDNLVIDEAHEFKNLEYATSGDRLVGMNSPDGSQRAFDLYIKTRGLMAREGAVGFLTGTPVSNSLVEIYTVMKYLAPDMLRDMGLMHFDSWSSSFVQSKTRFEYTAAQKLKERNVLAGLTNLGPLSDIYRSFADIVMRRDVERIYREQMEKENAANGTDLPTRFPTPKVRGGGRQLVSLPSSPAQDEFTDYLVMRMGGIQANSSNKEYAATDNALWVLSDARKASIDIRTVDPEGQRHDQSKVVAAGRNILRVARQWEKQRGTQMVFADSSVPTKNAAAGVKKSLREAWGKAGLSPTDIKQRLARDEAAAKPWAQQWGEAVEAIEARLDSGDLTSAQQDSVEAWMNGDAASDGAAAAFTSDSGFSFYDDLKAYLVEEGMEPDEIAFIHDYSTSDAKNALFEQVNEGKVRVLIGSTFKMGAGTNAQKRLVALHHIDAPWRPSDMEQREGRIIRPGNALYEADPEGFEVEITAYTTEKTSDVVLWQVLERKAAGIEQFLNSTADKLIDEDGSDADSYAEFMAQSTGNPVFLRKMETEKAVRDMQSQQSSMRMVVSEARQFLSTYETRMDYETRAIDNFQKVNFDAYPDAGKSFEAYRDAVRAFDSAKAAHEKKVAAVRAANKKLVDGGKRQLLPKFDVPVPTLFDGKLDKYTKRVRDAIQEAEDTGDSAPIRIGSAEVRVVRKDTAADGVYAYDLEMSVKGQGYVSSLLRSQAVVKSPLKSRALTAALSPAAIRAKVSAEIEMAKTRMQRMEAAAPEMKKKAAIQIDGTALKASRRDLEMYKGMVRLAEVEQAQDRIGKVNRFAVMDSKGRDLELNKTDDAPLLPPEGEDTFTFEHEGTTYRSALGAQGGTTSGTEGRYTIYWFGAETDDGKPALIQATRRAKDTGKAGEAATEYELDVIDVFDTSTAIERPFEMRGTARAVEQSDIRDITRDLNAEMQATGLDGKVNVRIVKKLVSEISGAEIRGQFSDRDGITVAAAGASDTMRHEIIHALRSEGLWGRPYGLFTQAEWRGLVRAARANGEIARSVKEQYSDDPASVQTEEMVAEMYRIWAAGQSDTDNTMSAFGKVQAFITALGNALRGRGFQSAAMTMQRIAGGRVGSRAQETQSSNAPMSNQPKEMRAPAGSVRAKFKGMLGSSHWRDPRGFVSNKLTDAMAGNGDYSLLALVPGQPLFAELGKRIPAAQAYLRNKIEMDSLRNDWHGRADTVAQKWRDLRNKDQKSNDILMDLMHRTTIAQVDPTTEYDGRDSTWAREEVRRNGKNALEWAQRKVAQDNHNRKEHDRLQRIYRNLPPEFQAIYGDVRAEYDKMGDDWEDAVLENVKNSMRVALKRAEKEHKRAMARIEEDGLDGRERADAVAEADEALRRAKERNGAGANKKVQSLRAEFENNRLSGPYFPLSRFGQYFVTVRDEDGQVTSFSQFETEADQQEFIARMEKANPGRVKHGLMDDTNSLRDAVNPTFVADIEALLSEADVSAELMDAVWQRWLATMPDQSIRTSRIHRTGRAGFNENAARAFERHMFHGSHQLARLRYGILLEESLDDARDEARVADNPNRATALVNEMGKRHEYTMNPKGSSIIAGLSSMAFVWYLGASPAAAAVNLSQTTIMGPPIMAARFQKAGVKGALSEILKASKDFGRGKGHAASSKRLTADEKKAMHEAYRRGTVDKTQSHNLASVQETSIEYNAVREKWMRKIGWMFHHTERMNREVTFLASYRLARADGLRHVDAIDAAADMTWKIHYDYQNTARPRFMQGDIGRILTTFRQFTVNSIYRMFRDAHQMLNGATKEERREAKLQLVGITLSMMAHAGIRGTWGYGLIMGALALFFPGDADDLEDWMQDALLMEGDDPGTAAWNFAMGAALNGTPGHILGINLTERIGMPNLWFRGPGRELEGRDLYAHYVAEMLGPVYGVGEGIVRGAFSVIDGEVLRGAESMVPKAIRDVMRTGRYAAEGVQTWNGDPIVDDPNPWELLWQANGFTPSRIAERYDINNRLKNRERKIMDERKGLHRAASDALQDKQPIPVGVMEKIRDFNTRYPEYPITGDTIRRSFKGRMRAKERNEFGVSLNPKLNLRLRSEVAPGVYN